MTTIPPIGNIEAYLRAVRDYPMLTLEEEQHHGRRVRDFDDQASAEALVLSHLRFVASTARKFKYYGLAEEDLIQEGTIGLMKATKGFDPDQGFRFVSYAVHWIKSEIQVFIVKNYRIAKIATTHAQRKLFFNLRSMKIKLHGDSETESSILSEDEIKFIAEELKVKPEEVIEMEKRFMNHTISLSPISDDDDAENFFTSDISDTTYEPTMVLEGLEEERLFKRIEEELENLSERERDIINQRWLIPMVGESKVPFVVLADKYGISTERVRQIEKAAFKRVRKGILNVAEA